MYTDYTVLVLYITILGKNNSTVYSYIFVNFNIICTVFYHVFKFIIVAPVRRREFDTAQCDLWRTSGSLISGKSTLACRFGE